MVGQTMVYENGVLPAETDGFPLDYRCAVADVDLDLLRQERLRTGTFDDNRRTHAGHRPTATLTLGSATSNAGTPTPRGRQRTD
jgi:hypothetical protein